MNKNPMHLAGYLTGVSWVVFMCGVVSASNLDLADKPLFTVASAKPNVMLAIDDSGSMDFEVLFPTNDGALWWEDGNDSFSGAGTLGQFNFQTQDPYKTVYLFPNGTGAGNRIYTNHYEIPPLPQYAFARSARYNKAYYDPAVYYEPWIDYGTTNHDDIVATSAPSDPFSGGTTFDLTSDMQTSTNNWTFRLRQGMVIPPGTVYAAEGSGSWSTAATPITVYADQDYGIRYYPATYYVELTSGSYTVKDPSGYTHSGDCASPDAQHYTYFEDRPGDLTSVNVHALGPDGVCLRRVEIKPSTTSYTGGPGRVDCADPLHCDYGEEIQNFANWFSYYRKRHLALRAGMAASFDGVGGIRTGLFTINNRQNVTMLDMDTQSETFFDSLFGIDGNGGGTPNREALDYAGQQFMRSDAAAPITHSCQQNFTLQFTDGFSVPSTGIVGNEDFLAGVPYKDDYSSTLADIAMKYYTTTLRSGAGFPSGDVPVPAGCSASPPDPKLDCNADLHMNTYTVGLNAVGTLFGVTHNTVADAYANAPAWPDVTQTRDPAQIDDLYHAAVNGRGEMFSADTPVALRTALDSALRAITSNIGSASSVSFNTGSVRAGTLVYQARFSPADWGGQLIARALHDGSGNNGCAVSDPVGTLCSNPVWDANCSLTGGPCPTTNDPTNNSPNLGSARQIITTNSTTNAGVPLSWAQLSAVQQASLNIDASGTTDSLGADRISYLRGDRSTEELNGGSFRNRKALLGDIVHGNPLYVGPPVRRYPASWTDRLGGAAPENGGTQSYADFKTAYSGRMGMVYTGANDGYLHAFRTGKLDVSGNLVSNDGKELLAYMPSQALANARHLTYTNYAHQYYVDGAPVENDVFYNDGWHSVLVGGLGVGGQGLYALNVSNPGLSAKPDPQFSEANAGSLVLWEFTDQDDPDLGYTVGPPVIVRLHNGKWGVVVGNGYNSSENDGAQSPDGDSDGVPDAHAILFVLDVETGAVLAKLDTGKGAADDPLAQNRPNGLGAVFPIDKDGDLITDYVYGGDLFGNVWRFDLTDTDPLNWHPSDYDGNASIGTPTPLFTAVDGSGNPQPITTQVQVAQHPYGLNWGVMVYFGTGKYVENGDQSPNTSMTQSFYGIWDKDFDIGQSSIDVQDALDSLKKAGFARNELQVQQIDALETASGNTFRRVTDNPLSYTTAATTKHGWYLDLKLSGGSNQGEMVIADPVVRGKAVVFTTLVPSDNPCVAGGTGFLMVLNQATGGRLQTSPFDVDKDGNFSPSDLLDFGDSGNETASGIDVTGGTPGFVLAQGHDLALIPEFDGSVTGAELNLGVPVSGRKSWWQLR
jgi:type IV pilus assembly protein PilY1